MNSKKSNRSKQLNSIVVVSSSSSGEEEFGGGGVEKVRAPPLADKSVSKSTTAATATKPSKTNERETAAAAGGRFVYVDDGKSVGNDDSISADSGSEYDDDDESSASSDDDEGEYEDEEEDNDEEEYEMEDDEAYEMEEDDEESGQLKKSGFIAIPNLPIFNDGEFVVNINGINMTMSSKTAACAFIKLNDTGDLIVGNVAGLPTDESTTDGLVNRLLQKKIWFVFMHKKQVLSTGYGDWETHTLPILIKEPFFCAVLNHLRKHGWVVIDGYLLYYTKDGKLEWHRDKKFYGRATHRFAVTVTASDKIFGLKIYVSRKECFEAKMELPHGALIGMSKFMAGVENEAMRHCTNSTAGSMTLVLHAHIQTVPEFE